MSKAYLLKYEYCGDGHNIGIYELERDAEAKKKELMNLDETSLWELGIYENTLSIEDTLYIEELDFFKNQKRLSIEKLKELNDE